MNAKPKALIVGGMPFNVPKELSQRFDIVKHIDQSKQMMSFPKDVAVVFCLINWVAHSTTNKAREVYGDRVFMLRSWPVTRAELIKRGFLEDDPPPITDATVAPPVPAVEPATETGLTPEEVWETYGRNLIDTVRTVFKPGEKVSERDLFEAFDLVGLPRKDAEAVMPDLQMRGVIEQIGERRWRIPVVAEDRPIATMKVKIPSPPVERAIAMPPSIITVPHSTSSKLRHELAAGLLRGIPMGPYTLRSSLISYMKRYLEFLSPLTGSELCLSSYYRIIEIAVKHHWVEEHHGKFYVDHDPSIKLTPAVRKEVAHG